jgi:hypothetical protein
MPTLFGNKSRRAGNGVTTNLDQLIDGIQNQMNQNGSSFATRQLADAALAMESLDSATAVELSSCVDNLNAALESICGSHGLNINVSQAQRDAAAAAGVLAGNIPAWLKAPTKQTMTATENMTYVEPSGGADFFDSRMRVALEAYDEKENKNAVVYSVAYNLQAARQDEFGETFFPTVVVTPDQVGFTVSIRLISVYNEVRRQITGNLDQFNKRNIIQAVIDPSILQNDQTKIVPVYRDESKSHFVDAALITPKTVLLDSESITTSALAMGDKFSLLAISQTDALLETGLLDTTDSIDTAIALATLYMKISGTVGGNAVTEVLSFQTSRLPLATMTYSVQNNYRLMNLAFNTNSLLVGKDTKKVDGSASALLAPVVSGSFSVRLGVQVGGSVNLELADTSLFSSNVSVVSVQDQDGNFLDMTTGQGKAIADLFVGASMVGYDLDARRTNLNRRQRGQLLDTTFYNQIYAVPLRAPITVPRPLTLGDANDSSDLAALITATHIRTSNAAVDEILRVGDYLAEYVGTNAPAELGSIQNPTELLGVSRFLVQPSYEYALVDVSKEIDSLKSHERAADIQAVLVNKLRDMAYRMYRNSGYKAAADALAGGTSQVPTVMIGTDPVISRYLTVTGDLRTLGNDFNVRVVSTLNQRMTGKIVMSFGQEAAGSEGVPNPMHFGNMAWKPELTVVLPLHRNGANSKELTVQPAFLHVTNLPILAVLDITGISDVVAAKVNVNTHSV